MAIVFRFHYLSILKVTTGNAIEAWGIVKIEWIAPHVSLLMMLN